MTNAELIEKALERLSPSKAVVEYTRLDTLRRSYTDLTQPLAALIRQLTADNCCGACDGINRESFTGGYRILPAVRHREGGALLALCKAIMEGKG